MRDQARFTSWPGFLRTWEEIQRSLEMVEFFDLDAVAECAPGAGSALTAARVAFLQKHHHEALMVEDQHLEALREKARRPGASSRHRSHLTPTPDTPEVSTDLRLKSPA